LARFPGPSDADASDSSGRRGARTSFRRVRAWLVRWAAPGCRRRSSRRGMARPF